ncbi:MAG: hypothetical protein DWQ36_00055 [Acidobacteria bacterium]|nr:MAG: hypothetical protein DWQ30_18325 [Acidobacteriota bacterium]REK12098.1 MAG: hypothetical protein DWQ36_00055 [Acidobacteriota bacterium]
MEPAEQRPTADQVAAPRPAPDPFAPVRWVAERERAMLPGGAREVRSATLFLVGSECPFSCTFCDLGRHTLGRAATPAGAIPRQIVGALAAIEASGGGPMNGLHTVKLYNASNWFEERAVPGRDDAAVLGALAEIPRVTVECHPRLAVSGRCEAFARARRDGGGELEIALGLETSRPEVFARLGKGCDLGHMERALLWLAERRVVVRLFVLVGLPWIDAGEQVAAAVESVGWAAARGAASVSLIPLRPTPQLRRAARAARADDGRGGRGVAPVSLALFEDAVGAACEAYDERWGGPLVVRADLWDLDALPACRRCGARRRAAMRRRERRSRGWSDEEAACCDRCRRALPGEAPAAAETRS